MLRLLFETIESRKVNMPEDSYTARLLAAGEQEILSKIAEEAAEVQLAAEQQGDQRVVEELADLFYHSLVLLLARGLNFADLEAELRRRHQPHG
jgi:phosphoribosyl-ATP pyrophosphohydrolase